MYYSRYDMKLMSASHYSYQYKIKEDIFVLKEVGLDKNNLLHIFTEIILEAGK